MSARRFFRKWFSCLMSLAIAFSVASGWSLVAAFVASAFSQTNPDPHAHIDGGRLVFKGPVHAHDLIYTPLEWEQAPGRVVAEAEIHPVSNPGSTWRPALYLYWETDKFTGVGISGNGQFNTSPGGYIGSAPLGQTYKVRVVWENGAVELYGGPVGAEPALLRTYAAPAEGPPTHLIVGKGHGDGALYPDPFLANDFADPGSPGLVYMDNITVYADGELYLSEDFESGINLSRWTMLVSTAGQPSPPVDPASHVVDGRIVFKGPANAHDLIYTPLIYGSAPAKVAAEAEIQPVVNPGSSWAPSLTLYWNTDKYVSIGISANQQYNLRPGGYSGVSAPLGKTYRLRIEWENGTVKLFGGEIGAEELTLLKTAAAPASGAPPYIIVGKGFGAIPQYPKPFLANDFSDPGSPGLVYMDNIAVYADGALILEESFESGLDTGKWTLLMSPAGQPKPVPTIEELFPNWKTPAERGPASAPQTLYKAADWEAYYENYNNDPSFRQIADEQIALLRDEVALTMSYDEAQIENMIPALTPLANLFTPCPNAPELGFPHGAWEWNPEDPDRIYCAGLAFPNEQYPEEGELVANWGGVEQRFTFYIREQYDFNGFKLSPSFTSYIRAQKVAHMSKQVNKIALLYRLTGETQYAEQAKRILLRFAEVYPRWLLHSGYGEIADMDPKEAAININRLSKAELTTPGNVPDFALHAGYWMAGRGNGNGMEGSFILPIVNAYDLIADAQVGGAPLLTEDERLAIERDLLLEAATLFISDPANNNKSISNQTAAAAIGVVLGEPSLVHFGLKGFNQMLGSWYQPDGSPNESPAYGLQVIGYLLRLGEILNGYSEPEDYVPPAGQQRLERYSVYDRADYRMVFRTIGDSLLPSLTYPVVGDSYMTSKPGGSLLAIGATRTGLPILTSLMRHGGFDFTLAGADYLLYRPDNLDAATPIMLPDVLFPQWRLAYLRGGEDHMDSTAILNASGWGGHRHKDSLDFTYWANGGEALSDLGYLWDNPHQNMTVRSAAHNLVVVDEKDQVTSNRGGSYRFYETAAPFKAAEAESRAYAETDVYNRLLLQVQAAKNKPEYVVDVFRVRGGNSHDYVMHAATEDFAAANIALAPGGETAVAPYGLTDVATGTANRIVWTTDWHNSGGEGRTKVWHVPFADEQIYIGNGWGQRTNEDTGAQLPYIVRHLDNTPDGNMFVSVVESYVDNPGIKDVTPLAAATDNAGAGASAKVGLQISGNGWHDFVFAAAEGHEQETVWTGGYGGKPITFAGKMGVLSFAKGNGMGGLQYAFLAGEGRLEYEGEGVAIAAGQELQGTVGESMMNGFAATGEIAGAEQWIGSHVLVRNGSDWTAYPVLDVQVINDKTHFITYDGNEGFPFAGGEAWKLIPYVVAERTPSGAWTIVASAGQAQAFGR